MKKILGAALLSVLLFTGCLDDNNEAYENYQKIAPGATIYSNAKVQNALAMQGANAGMRLAILLAEAAQQEQTDLTKVLDDGKSVMQTLFTKSVKIEGKTPENTLEEGDFRIVFNSGERMYDGFFLSGSMIVRTGGNQLDKTTPSTPWLVEPEEGFRVILLSSAGVEQTLRFVSGTTSICFNGDGSYSISLDAMRWNFDKIDRYSDWNGTCRLRPAVNSLAYSACKDKDFTATIEMGGASVFAFASTAGTTGTRMTYKLSNGKFMNGGLALTGMEECTLPVSGEYDPSQYPSPIVRVTSSYDSASNRLSAVLEYNGFTQSLY